MGAFTLQFQRSTLSAADSRANYAEDRRIALHLPQSGHAPCFTLSKYSPSSEDIFHPLWNGRH
jgi:hypothetical protein